MSMYINTRTISTIPGGLLTRPSKYAMFLEIVLAIIKSNSAMTKSGMNGLMD